MWTICSCGWWYFCRKFCKKKKTNRPRSTLSNFRKYLLVYFCATLMSFMFKSILFKIHSKDVNIKISPWPNVPAKLSHWSTRGGNYGLIRFSFMFSRAFFFHQRLLFTVALRLSLRHILAKFGENQLLWLRDRTSFVKPF